MIHAQRVWHSWIAWAASKLSIRRLRAQALILTLCLWGTVAVDYATPGPFDRAGNIKFQDFLQFPISASLIAHGQADQLYDDEVLARDIHAIVSRDTNVYLQYFYGPQVAVPFIPFISLGFITQARIWTALSMAAYFLAVYFVWKRCPALQPYCWLVTLCALAYPPLFHCFVRGQLSPAVLACVAAAYFALELRHDFLGGMVLGLLAFKPQFLVAIPFVLLLARAWKFLAGLIVSAGLQIVLTWAYFGSTVMQAYSTRLLHSGTHPGLTELTTSPIQMHSLYSFWEILIRWQPAVWVLYLLSSALVIVLAAQIWKSSVVMPVRFSALMLAAVLVNPHIYIYDLLALTPMFLTLADWLLWDSKYSSEHLLRVLLYLAFLLPLFGPIARWIHLQLSVLVFFAILWNLRFLQSPRSRESGIALAM